MCIYIYICIYRERGIDIDIDMDLDIDIDINLTNWDNLLFQNSEIIDYPSRNPGGLSVQKRHYNT